MPNIQKIDINSLLKFTKNRKLGSKTGLIGASVATLVATGSSIPNTDDSGDSGNITGGYGSGGLNGDGANSSQTADGSTYKQEDDTGFITGGAIGQTSKNADAINIGAAGAIVNGGAGSDIITGNGAVDYIRGGNGADVIRAGGGYDYIVMIAKGGPTYSQTDITNPNDSGVNLSELISLEDINAKAFDDSAPNAGEIIDGGGGGAGLFIYGHIILHRLGQTIDTTEIANITRVDVLGHLEISDAQINLLTNAGYLNELIGSADSKLTITHDPAQARTEVSFSEVFMKNIGTLEVSEGVVLLLDQDDLAGITHIIGSGTIKGVSEKLDVTGIQIDQNITLEDGNPIGGGDLEYVMTALESPIEHASYAQNIEALDGGGYIIVSQVEYNKVNLVDGWGSVGQIFNAKGEKTSEFSITNDAVEKSGTAEYHASGYPSAITQLENGHIVVAWHYFSGDEDNFNFGLKAAIFDKNGEKIGSELIVRNQDDVRNFEPDLLATKDGGFALSWRYGDATGYDVKAQLFDKDGAINGQEFIVNNDPSQNHYDPNITSGDNGGIEIYWKNFARGNKVGTTNQEDKLSEYGQKFDASGQKIGSVFDVDGQTIVDFDSPLIAKLEGGGYVEVNSYAATDGADKVANSVHAQIYDDQHNKVGDSFLVNDIYGGSQLLPKVAGLEGGGFSVIWYVTTGEVKIKTYRPEGYVAPVIEKPKEDEIPTKEEEPIVEVNEYLVNSEFTGLQSNSEITALNNGGYAITWVSDDKQSDDKDASAIKAQLFDAEGDAVGGEFLVNTFTTSHQLRPDIVTLDSGNIVIAWQSADQKSGDKSETAIRLSNLNTEGVFASSDVPVNSHHSGTQQDVALAALDNGNLAIVWASEDGRDDFDAGKVDSSGFSIKLQITNAFGIQVSTTQISSEILVNSQTAGDQTAPDVISLSDGNIVVAWVSDDGADADKSGNAIKAQLYTQDGIKVGNEILLNSEFSGDQQSVKLAALSGGGFAAIWESFNENGTGNFDYTVMARIFNAAGAANAVEFQVSANHTDGATLPAITALDDGGFFTTWNTHGVVAADAEGYDIKGKKFNANGDAIGEEFDVNDIVANDQSLGAITQINGGKLVATWTSSDGLAEGSTSADTDLFAIKANILNLGSPPSAKIVDVYSDFIEAGIEASTPPCADDYMLLG